MNALGASSVAQDGNALPYEQRLRASSSNMMSLIRAGAPVPLVPLDLSSFRQMKPFMWYIPVSLRVCTRKWRAAIEQVGA